MIELTVVIPSWNTRELLRACLERLFGADLPESEVIVVDNASEDGSPDMVARDFPGVVLLRNPGNEGFAIACNQGMRLAQGRFVLLLNSDTEVQADAIGRLLTWLEDHPEYGAAAPRLVSPDGTTQRSLKRFPNLWTPLFFATPLERWWPRSPELRRYFLLDRSQEESFDVEQPPAACLLVRSEVIERIGPFDEDLWLFFNDVDLSKRMAGQGWKSRYVADSVVLHHEGASTARYARFQPEWHRNRLHYYRKHHGRLAGAWVKLCVTLAFADYAIAQLWRRARRRGGEPIRPTARQFGAFLLQ